MKMLRITAEGIPLFKEKLDVCFYTQQRMSEDGGELLPSSNLCVYWY